MANYYKQCDCGAYSDEAPCSACQIKKLTEVISVLMPMAKIGEAALDAIEKEPIDIPCQTVNFDTNGCDRECDWYKFCKLRLKIQNG